MANIKEKESVVKRRREFYALSIVTIPTILVAIVSQYIDDMVTRFLAQAILFFLQAVIVKGMLESRYTE